MKISARREIKNRSLHFHCVMLMMPYRKSNSHRVAFCCFSHIPALFFGARIQHSLMKKKGNEKDSQTLSIFSLIPRLCSLLVSRSVHFNFDYSYRQWCSAMAAAELSCSGFTFRSVRYNFFVRHPANSFAHRPRAPFPRRVYVLSRKNEKKSETTASRNNIAKSHRNRTTVAGSALSTRWKNPSLFPFFLVAAALNPSSILFLIAQLF